MYSLRLNSVTQMLTSLTHGSPAICAAIKFKQALRSTVYLFESLLESLKLNLHILILPITVIEMCLKVRADLRHFA